MVVLGIDLHKKSHTIVAVQAATGEVRGELTVDAGERGHEQLLAWARGLFAERQFALEGCRHVSGHLERFLCPSTASGASAASSPTAALPSEAGTSPR